MKMNKLLFPVSLIIVAVLGFIDHWTGYEMSFSIFYLLPVSLLAWYQSIRQGITISVFSAVIWLIADLSSGHRYSYFLIPLWNMLMRLTVFIIIVLLLHRARKELQLEKMLSSLDVLTGLNNSRSFIKQANIEKSRSSRLKRPFTIAYIDVDNFKQVNDVFGHARGDILLQNIGKVIKENLRAYDIHARMGGDEFIIFFPETDQKQAQVAVSKVKSCVEKTLKDHSDSLTLSIGALVVTNPDRSLDGIIKMADNLMYPVKKSSKNGIAYDTLD